MALADDVCGQVVGDCGGMITIDADDEAGRIGVASPPQSDEVLVGVRQHRVRDRPLADPLERRTQPAPLPNLGQGVVVESDGVDFTVLGAEGRLAPCLDELNRPACPVSDRVVV
jgi:hypothetical protein